MCFEHLSQYEADQPASERRMVKVLALASYRAAHVSKVDSAFYRGPTSEDFKVDDLVLAARETALSSVFKWPLFSSRFYGPRTIDKASQPCYKLKSVHKRYSHQSVHFH